MFERGIFVYSRYGSLNAKESNWKSCVPNQLSFSRKKAEQNWTKLEQNLSSVRASILPVKYIFTFTYCGTAIPLSIIR